MIDIISTKIPPPPTPHKQSSVDPVTSIPRSQRVEETESESEHEQPQKRKQKKHPPPDDNSSSNDGHPHIDNYA